jgi:hypothetical protein
MQELWPSAGGALLARLPDGALQPTAAYFQQRLRTPELALVAESCRAERRLHQALHADPLRPLQPAELAALQDADARQNYAHWLAWRDGLVAAGTLQGWYLALMRSGRIETPPVFIDAVVQAIVQHLLPEDASALQARAAELFFRPQRVTVEKGRVLAADRDSLVEQQATQGLGDLGRLLAQAQAPVKALQMRVLTKDEAPRYWAQARPDDALAPWRSTLLLDLTHEITRDVGHGLNFTMANAHSGLAPLAELLQRWVQHLLGVAVRVRPLRQVDDAQWRWHVGLDAEASALLNDLYEGRDVDAERQRRLLSLFRLDFEDPAEMRADVAGKPVYLGLAADTQQNLRMKPQNLLLNLPLARQS